MITAIIVPLVSDKIAMLVLLWLLMFTGSIHCPILIGVMLDSVKPEMRAQANSIAIMS